MIKSNTAQQHQQVIAFCKSIFEKKNKDYDTSWRVLRVSSFTDQILIKARRIRNITEKGNQRIGDDINSELTGIINYSLMALIQLQLEGNPQVSIPYGELAKLYDLVAKEVADLMMQKNYDYEEVWRDMRVNSMVDIILMKLLRIKHIEDNHGQTCVSEGVKANYQDIVNYAIFCLILRGLVDHPKE
ncbi:MAG: DUF1599 domain-containing protein [Bacteroidota bacterium]